MEIKYCIGKKSRKTYGSIVRKPSWESSDKWHPRYNELRSAIYDTEAEAEEAAGEATQYNHVGFVVLYVVGDAICSNCHGEKELAPQFVLDAAKRNEHIPWNEWEYETCTICNGIGYIDEKDGNHE